MSDTRRALLKQAGERLAAGGIETAALDARLLFQAASGLRHEDIVAEPDLIVPPDVAARFSSFIERRRKFEPVSRILGNREFYGRSFRVTPDVLDPRADTETLIEAVLALAKGQGPIADSRPWHGFGGHCGDLAGRIAGRHSRCQRPFGGGPSGCKRQCRGAWRGGPGELCAGELV